MKAIRLGIRGKLLLSFGAAIAFIVAMEMLAQYSSNRIAEDYEARLGRYHQVHRFRVALTDFRSASDRYLRDPGSSDIGTLYAKSAGLAAMDASLRLLLPSASHDAFFEIQATGFGMDAYLPPVSRALAARSTGKADYYADFVKAEKIAAFMDGYLSKLLTILMKEGEAEYRESVQRSVLLREITLGGMILAGVIALAFGSFMASSITAPVRKLAKASERLASGDLDVEPIRARGGDEVETLARNFSLMSANIRSLVEGLREKAELEKRLHEEEIALVRMGKALREAQFMNLQDQMRPHFLFNALNSIARSALLEGATRTEILSRGLAKLMRYALAGGEPYVSLEDELATVREYLAFQKVRFGERLDWDIKADPELPPIKVPRFSVQPFIENAVRHGIEPLERGGKVLVAARVRRGKLFLTIADSGGGMDSARLSALRGTIEAAFRGEDAGATAGTSGIGLANVASRLYLKYGIAASMHLLSSPGRGTLVRIAIPLSSGEDQTVAAEAGMKLGMTPGGNPGMEAGCRES
ncbi:MAG: histidine kinase [Rectinema sp.]